MPQQPPKKRCVHRMLEGQCAICAETAPQPPPRRIEVTVKTAALVTPGPDSGPIDAASPAEKTKVVHAPGLDTRSLCRRIGRLTIAKTGDLVTCTDCNDERARQMNERDQRESMFPPVVIPVPTELTPDQRNDLTAALDAMRKTPTIEPISIEAPAMVPAFHRADPPPMSAPTIAEFEAETGVNAGVIFHGEPLHARGVDRQLTLCSGQPGQMVARGEPPTCQRCRDMLAEMYGPVDDDCDAENTAAEAPPCPGQGVVPPALSGGFAEALRRMPDLDMVGPRSPEAMVETVQAAIETVKAHGSQPNALFIAPGPPPGPAGELPGADAQEAPAHDDCDPKRHPDRCPICEARRYAAVDPAHPLVRWCSRCRADADAELMRTMKRKPTEAEKMARLREMEGDSRRLIKVPLKVRRHIVDDLDALVESGYFGADREEVAGRLLHDGLRAVMLAGWPGRKG